jgi:hypothetical protein
VRAADEAKPGKGLIRLSDTDPCVVLGEGTSFLSQFSPKTQIMLPKNLNFAVAEVVEVISDTELRIKKEFGGENGKGTARFREAVKESEAKESHTRPCRLSINKKCTDTSTKDSRKGAASVYSQKVPFSLPPSSVADHSQVAVTTERISSHLKLVSL